jgi:hypothetical protein
MGKNRTAKRIMLCTAAIIGPLVVAYLNAFAMNFQGYSRPRQRFDNRGDCCENAVYLAQADAARACEDSGGYPELRRSTARGRCKSSTGRDADGTPIYFCEASASVSCHSR